MIRDALFSCWDKVYVLYVLVINVRLYNSVVIFICCEKDQESFNRCLKWCCMEVLLKKNLKKTIFDKYFLMFIYIFQYESRVY